MWSSARIRFAAVTRLDTVRWNSSLPPSTRLIEIGCLEDPKLSPFDNYAAGQFFLHRVFGYRGVILFHWVSRVYDREAQQTPKPSYSQWEEEGKTAEKIRELKPDRQTYYQVLIDQRDFSQIRTSPEAVTFTGDVNDKSLYSILGVDYVKHGDVLPYSTSNNEPLQHELFPQFFIAGSDKNCSMFHPKVLLSYWHQKNVCWLEAVEVHREITRGISVTVMPFFMGSREMQRNSTSVYWWRYSIRIENLSGARVQLRQRHWRIYSSTGSQETVHGDGVVGHQPVLSLRQPAFQYSSHVSLQVPRGHMWGTFQMEREDGKMFEVRVPPFPLESRDSD